MRYILGLDIGITSAGWAVVNLDRRRIEHLGVRAFTKAEQPKTGASLAEPRRLARSARRRLRRRAGRLERVRDLFVQHGLLSENSLSTAFLTTNDKLDPWQLRAEGLDRILTREEFARALYHIAKRRGFLSNRKHDRTGDAGKMLAAIDSNKQALVEGGYRTAGEMLYVAKDERFQEPKRNKGDSYTNNIDRLMLMDEIRLLFDAQRKLGSSCASQELENQFMEAFKWQLPFASGEDILRKVGYCTFLKDQEERRAPKAAYTTERYILLGKLNSISLSANGDHRPLSQEERQIALAYAYQKQSVTYADLRKKLALPVEVRFRGLTYSRKRGQMEEDMACEKAAVFHLSGYHAFKKAFTACGIWEQVSGDQDLMDNLAYALTFYKTDEDIRSWLAEQGVEDSVIDGALTITGFSKVGNLSTKAMRMILPYLEEGHVYSKACELAGFSHYNPDGATPRSLKLPPIEADEIRNPVVIRALSQSRKVINAITREWGPPVAVHIELSREIGKTFDERQKINRVIEDNRRDRQADDDSFLKEFGIEPRGDTRAKWRLYREQNGQCAYSRRALDEKRLLEPGYAEIDHILPYSRSFDDSFANRVLVHCAENREKRNRTPFEYFGSNEARWAQFEAWVRANIKDYKKRGYLLKTSFDQRDEEEWKKRSLTNTQWIATYLSNYLRRHLQFADAEVKSPVVCFSGRVTALARGLWGLEKHREENDLHHAMDAAVAAVLTPGRIKAITEYRKAQEMGRVTQIVDEETGEVYEVIHTQRFFFPEPWKRFRRELLARLSDDPAAGIASLGLASYAEDPPKLRPLLVSRMPMRKIDGPIHAETIRSAREVEGKRVAVSRIRLVDLKDKHLEKLYAPETNRELYAAIRERMLQFGGEGKKAFEQEFRKPTRSGKPGPIVRRVKIVESQPSGYQIREGIADNGSMVRTDVFRKKGKYYLVPIYVSDCKSGILPNRAIAAHKPEEEWVEMDQTYEFLFSLYPYDLVRVVLGSKEFVGYYKGTHRGNGSLTLSPPNNDRDSEEKDFGVRLAALVEKFYVSVLGEVTPVAGEKRLDVANGGGRKSGGAED